MFSKNRKITPEQLLFLEGLDHLESDRERERMLATIRKAIHPCHPRQSVSLRDYARHRGLGLREIKHILIRGERPVWVACQHCQTITLLDDDMPQDWFEQMEAHHPHHQLSVFSTVEQRSRCRHFRYLPPMEMVHRVSGPVSVESLYRSHEVGPELLRVLDWLDVATLEEAAEVVHFPALARRFPEFRVDLEAEFEQLMAAQGLVMPPQEESGGMALHA